MGENNKDFLVRPAVILGISVIIGTFLWSSYFYKTKSIENAITVTGSSERMITSDTARWTSNFSRSVGAGGLNSGSSAMKNDLAAVIAYFKSQGLTDAEITVQPVSVSSTCDETNNYMYDKFGGRLCSADRISGYSFQQSIVVQSNDVSKVTKLAQDSVNYLTTHGVIFSSQNLDYFYSKLSDLKIEMLAEATANAKERAEKIAESSGGKLGALKSASQGVFQITQPNSIEVSDYGMYDTSTVEKKITAVARVSFLVK